MRRVWRIALGAAAVTALVAVGRLAPDRLPMFAGWVREQGAAGAAIFVVGYAALTVALVPGSLLTLAAGAIFGLTRGVTLVLLGAVAGSAAAFLIARYLARSAVERRLATNTRFAAIDRAVGEAGGRIVFLLRLSPLVPSAVLNYLLGLTRVRFRDYLLGSIGMIPGTMLYVYYGRLAGEVAVLAGSGSTRGTGHWVALGVGLLATAAATIVVTRAARQALRRVEAA